jgi:hypothetical protein
MARSPGFGSTPSDLTPYSDSVSLRLPYAVRLATKSHSLTHYAKGTQSPVFLQAPIACTQTVSGSISLPSPGFFSPFPHGTGSLSVSRKYLALEDGPPIFKQDFSCPALLVGTPSICLFVYGTITLSCWLFQTIPLKQIHFRCTGLFRVRSPLLTESQLISFPGGTEMFQFPPFASCSYVFRTQ